MTPIRVLERVTLTAPLGLRFQDVITGDLIGSGLRVLAYPVGDPSRKFELITNRGGIYVLRHAPGLREFERRDAGDVWQPPFQPASDAPPSSTVEFQPLPGRAS